MTEWIWINGNVIPMNEARISVEDRGFQFADGVYEVIRLYQGAAFTLNEHLERLEKSAQGIDLPMPVSRAELARAIDAFVARVQAHDGMIYLQLTRGAAPRNHFYPDASVPATLLFYTRPLPAVAEAADVPGAKLLVVDDERWKRCWVKSIALLPNVLAKNAAARQGADEALFVDEQQQVWECSASNLFAVIDGKIVTPPVGPKVLPGITRQVLIDLEPSIEVRPISIRDVRGADELFITSTTREISWVSHLDGHAIAQRPGAVTLQLHRRLQRHIAVQSRTVATAIAM